MAAQLDRPIHLSMRTRRTQFVGRLSAQYRPTDVELRSLFQTGGVHPASAAECLIPFFVAVTAGQYSRFTTLASDCALGLDRLARNVDQLIDGDKTWLSVKDMLSSIDRHVAHCLEPLQHYCGHEQLVFETNAAVQNSLLTNTALRGYCYTLRGTDTADKSTIEYLYPLIRHVLKQQPRSICARSLFTKATVYIQVLDDFVDLLDDLDGHIDTPLTLIAKGGSCSDMGARISAASFSSVAQIALEKMRHIYDQIVSEITEHYPVTEKWPALDYWRDFHNALQRLGLDARHKRQEQEAYLHQVTRLTPPVFCYVG